MTISVTVIECVDLVAARQAALKLISSILEEEADRGVLNLDREFIVRDERGEVVLRIPFRDALQ